MNIDFHIAEYNASVTKIDQNIQRGAKPKLNPVAISYLIFNTLKNADPVSYESGNVKSFIGHYVRQLHDFYGWKSKDSTKNLGLCSGAVFRSQGYMRIDPALRSGKKIDKDSDFGVHIEHSIPVGLITDNLLNSGPFVEEASEIFDLIMMHSACTAFSRIEEKASIKSGLHKKHPDIESYLSEANAKEVNPFARYTDETRIFSMLTGKEVESVSLIDVSKIYKDSHIYNWGYLTEFY